MNDNFRKKRNEFIFSSFRDVADKDYIAARALHQINLFDHFSWFALQAIEKYLKTILLIYNKNTKKIRHDLKKGLNEVEQIKDINWDFDSRIKNLVGHLCDFADDRYFTIPKLNVNLFLDMLDYSVWKIRRYCKDFY